MNKRKRKKPVEQAHSTVALEECLGVKLSKEVKDFRNEYLKMLKKEVIRRWKGLPCSLMEKMSNVKTASYLQQDTNSMQSSPKCQCNSSEKLIRQSENLW